MTTRALATCIENLRCLLGNMQATKGDAAAPGVDGAQVRALYTGCLGLTGQLREHLAGTTDPRLALELATAAQQMAAEATRLALVAAERVNTTAANTLAQTELEALRREPADTTRAPERANGRPSYKNAAELLASWTRTPYAEANRRVLDAQDLVARRDLTGSPVPPRFTHLGRQFFNPAQDPQAVREISQKLARVEPADTTFDGIACTPTLHHADGRTLEEHAAQALDTEFTAAAAAKKVGTLISQAANDPQTATAASRRRGLYKLPVRNRYYREYLLRVSTLEGGLIDSLIAQANNPRTQAGKAARNNPDSASTVPHPGASATPQPAAQEAPDFLPEGAETARWDEDDFQPPEAAPAERALNALLDVLEYEPAGTPRGTTCPPDQDPLFDPDPETLPGDMQCIPGDWDDGENTEVPGPVNCPPRTGEYITELTARGDPTRLGNRKFRRSKRIRPLLVAHMYIENLQDIASAHAETQHGVDLPPAALRQLECQADLISAVFNADGALLDFGRRQRLVPDILQKAVLARDRGCIVPGCTASVEHLDFHHVIPFSQGGKTNPQNIVPACRTHHMELDLGLIEVIWRKGLPWVLLPPDRDPDQRLRRNHVPPGVPTSLPLHDTG
ncbi:HNH endonuclease [Glutamicibacter sp. MNS18]|uniref:HNH endonuclease signature motif containing protein n=1 Tax=Glutamicibacter sp. MNS18 TaxID=2989817 RepID=UPI002235678F|nr:HNH endonuclease signature motif containing protein [Glutamicibacter sp. MNS18]MCW4464229.1 HNH endonuclease [Glutamicibacter sp. MNS18]